MGGYDGGTPFRNRNNTKNPEALVNEKGELAVTIEGARTAFGELSIAEFQPQCGWSFNYNINNSVVKIVELLGGTVTQEGSFAKLQTSTNASGIAVIRTRRSLVYTPGIGALARFTAVFDTPVEDSQQIIGIGNQSDGWFFGYNGLQFGIMKLRDGIEEWIYQEDWSEDTYSSLIPQNGNVYQISYQWLGFGMQYFGIENKIGDITCVHQINYANQNINVSVNNPSLPITALVINLGNTSNVTLKTPSAVAGLMGEAYSSAFETLVAYERVATIAANTETKLFALQNPATWLTKDNRLYILPKLFAAASEGNKPVVFRVYANPVLTDPVWVDVSPDISPLQYDISGTWVPNGEAQVFTLPLGKADSDVVDLSAIDAEIQPEQIYLITAESSGASDIVVGIDFKSRT